MRLAAAQDPRLCHRFPWLLLAAAAAGSRPGTTQLQDATALVRAKAGHVDEARWVPLLSLACWHHGTLSAPTSLGRDHWAGGGGVRRGQLYMCRGWGWDIRGPELRNETTVGCEIEGVRDERSSPECQMMLGPWRRSKTLC